MRVRNVLSGPLMLLAFAAACRAAAPADRLEFPPGVDSAHVALVRAGATLLAPVAINGQDAGLFLLDTGSSHTTLSRQSAGKLQLPVVSTGISASVTGGRSGVVICRVDSITVGGVCVRRTFVGSMDLSTVQKELGFELAGVIGGDFLGRMPITIDFPAAMLSLYRPGAFEPLDAAAHHALRIRERTPAIDLMIEKRLVAPFTIDTGMSGKLMLHTPFARAYPELLVDRPTRRVLVYGAGGVLDLRSIQFKNVEILGTSFSDVDTSYMTEKQGAASKWNAGILGCGLLERARLTLDYAAGKAWLFHDPQALPAEWAKEGFDCRSADLLGVSPLVRAIQLAAPRQVERFLDAGADVNTVDNEGGAPLHYAAKYDQHDAAQALLARGARINHQSGSGLTALHVAAAHASPELCRLLIRAGADRNSTDAFGRTPLISAVNAGHLAGIEEMIAAGADLNLISRSSGAALHVAALTGRADIAERLLKAGGKVDVVTDPEQLTPLALAASAGSLAVAELLLQRGADVNAKDKLHRTPIFAAAIDDNADMIRLLLDAGADPAALGIDGRNAFDYAAGAGRIAAMELLQPPAVPASKPATSASF